jgi:hypothetical protein
MAVRVPDMQILALIGTADLHDQYLSGISIRGARMVLYM